MIELATALESTALAEVLRRSRWLYPLVSAGHIFGIALLVGAVVPMDLAQLRGRALDLRGFAVAGLCLAVTCGAMLFAVQAREYLGSPWLWAKLGLIALALVNAALHLRRPGKRTALVSLMLWPLAIVSGRLIAFV